tara:strand:+ start:192 stop:482 length:291 start_codon:yes stop_codon:yes gene_type:complete
MISIIISIVACIFCTVAGVILYRYNQFSNDYYDVIDEVTDLLKAFSNYNEVLEIIEQHDVIGYDPLVSDLVVKTKALATQIEKSQKTLQNFLKEEE